MMPEIFFRNDCEIDSMALKYQLLGLERNTAVAIPKHLISEAQGGGAKDCDDSARGDRAAMSILVSSKLMAISVWGIR